MTFIAGPSKSATPAPSNSRKDEQSESVVIPQTLKAVGQFMECGECTKKFTVVRTINTAVNAALGMFSLILS